MPVYTLVITGADGHQHTTLSDFPDDRTAITDTGQFVSAEHPTTAVARGAGEDVDFIGAWDWSDGASNWTPED
jgi:hypothetical protein